jgi:hypothetical protein
MSTLQRDPRDRVQVLDEDGRVVDEYLHAVARVAL